MVPVANNASFMNAVDRVVKEDFWPTAFEINIINELEHAAEKVFVQNYTFVKPKTMFKLLKSKQGSYLPKVYIFVVDPSNYDEVVNADTENRCLPDASALLAAGKDFQDFYQFDKNDDNVQLLLLIFRFPSSLRTKLASRPFRDYYPGYMGDGTLNSITYFLEGLLRSQCSSEHTIMFTWHMEDGDENGL